MLKGKCEIFNSNKCFGCEGLARDDIDILKKSCDRYKEKIKEEIKRKEDC